MDKIIKIENLSFSYTNTKILNNVNFTVNKGDFLGIIGNNGSGKTTLLKLILGQLKPTHGNVVISQGTSIGYVEQVTMSSNNTFPASVLEIVLLGLYRKMKLFSFYTSTHKKMAINALKTVGLDGFENKQISTLSGGQQQRVLIAKALVSNPDLLILDEPTTGIDSESETEFLNLLQHINQHHKKTIIMVTHSFDKLSCANTILKVKDGNVGVEDYV